MKATLNDRVIADSTDIVEVDGYHYFPRATVKTEWLKRRRRPRRTTSARTAFSSTTS